MFKENKTRTFNTISDKVRSNYSNKIGNFKKMSSINLSKPFVY